MKKISILDCTLRDGGYINDFAFGEQEIYRIIDGLAKASIDIIECGFLRASSFDRNKTLFPSVESIKKHIPEKSSNSMYVAMIQCGMIEIDDIAVCDGTSVDGIRLTFHEHEIDLAINQAEQLMEKGYKVFIQPVGTTSYGDSALIDLIMRINVLKPYAFYIVDTLGKMYKNDLLRLFYIVDHNLDPRIALGFHSHNNLQMSFANAQELIRANNTRHLIIDSAVLGMGRGAGNLNTELLIQYLNLTEELKYDVYEIMNIMDQYIKPLSLKYKWGYDAAYYLAAVTNCHPNYATYLLNRHTLQSRDIGAILNSLDQKKRDLFDENYIQSEYTKYMDHYVDDMEVCNMIKDIIADHRLLILAPGKSLSRDSRMINSIIATGEYVTVSVNFMPKDIKVDFLFVSNMKRFGKAGGLYENREFRTIATSNISNPGRGAWIVNYSSYLNEENSIIDNAGIMCINLMKKIGIKEFLLAGFDGFSENAKENFYEESLQLDVEGERIARVNMAMAEKFKQLEKQVKISFVSRSFYEKELT